MNRQEIIDAYLFLRENNHSISDSTLNFMKDVALKEIDRVSNGRVCFSCKNDGWQQSAGGPCCGCQGSKYLNFVVKP